ncbi:MAG: pilus assembly protein, partial [Devosia sp.]|nr:pilus assembly protein [Devosia sp.]
GSIYEPFPASMVAIAEGQHVIVAETKMAVQPLYGIVIATPITLYRENFYMPRFEAPITLK